MKSLEKERQEKADEILEIYGNDRSDLIAILEDIQAKEEASYLPQEVLRYVAERLDIPLSLVYSVTTFYKVFSLEPRGRHIINVCLGTTCHVRGGRKILEKLESDLDVNSGETTGDFRFTLETVNCLGCCSIAPAMTIDNDTYGRLTLDKISGLLEEYE